MALVHCLALHCPHQTPLVKVRTNLTQQMIASGQRLWLVSFTACKKAHSCRFRLQISPVTTCSN